MEKWKVLVFLIIGYLLGIFVGDFILGEEFLKVFAVVALVLGLWIYGVGDFYLLVMIVGLVFGFYRFNEALLYSDFLEGNRDFVGCIVEEVDERVDKVKYVVEDSYGKVLVNAEKYPLYEYGDCLRVRGILTKPTEIEGFNYGEYLARYGIYAVINRAQIEKVSEEGGNSFFSWIFGLKGVFEERLNEVFAEPYASFMAGLILGSRKGIPEDLMADFNTTGLTHIIAISGYNITLLIVIVGSFFKFLSRRVKVFVSIVVIILFVVLVGMSAAVVRAGIMGIIGLLAIWFGRIYYVGMGMLISAFVMNLYNPLILVYDIGFQLSFLATAGLVYVSPFLEKYFKWLPSFMAMRESGNATISAQILALPVILLNFARLSLISPLANIFVLPFIPLAMFFGFLAVSLSFLLEPLGLFFGFIGYFILKVVVFIVRFFAAFPFASVDFEFMKWGMVLLYYFFVGMWVWKKNLTKISG